MPEEAIAQPKLYIVTGRRNINARRSFSSHKMKQNETRRGFNTWYLQF
jgi:hypothetical protein